MRLIDADRFEDELNEVLLPKLIKEYGKEEALKGMHFSFRDCICNIQSQPTVREQKKNGGRTMIKLKGVDETILVDLIRVILDSGYRPVITFAEVGRDTPLSEGLYDVAIITNGEDR